MKSIKYLLLSVVLLASACRKDAPELMNPNESRMTSTPSQVFETFWRAMNNTYVFWDIDPTDWDKIHDDYLPRFRELDALETIETESCRNSIRKSAKIWWIITFLWTLSTTRRPKTPKHVR